MKPRTKRLFFVILAVCCVGAASALISKAMKGNLAYLHTPEEVLAGEVPKGQVFRLGGLVKEGSLERSETELEARFMIIEIMRLQLLLQRFFLIYSQKVKAKYLVERWVMMVCFTLMKYWLNTMLNICLKKELSDTLNKEHTPAADKSKKGTY